MRLQNYITTFAVLGSTVLFSATVIAQDPDGDMLAGPSIQDEEVTQEDMRAEHARTTGKSKLNHQNKEQLRVWLRTLRSLDLTEDQQTEVNSLVQKYYKVQEAFQKEYGKEMRELREKSKEAKENGNDIPDDVGTRTKELMAISPNPEEYQSKMWVMLTDAQQSVFQKNYNAAIEAMKKRRKDQIGKDDSAMGDPMLNSDRKSREGIDKNDSNFRQRSRTRIDSPQAQGDATDDASLRRIRFLKRLRQLEKEN